MTDLIRRALLGDREAQAECTKYGIALPCPFCGGIAVKVYGKKGARLGHNGLDMPVNHYTVSARCTKCHTRGPTVGGKVLWGCSTRLLPGRELPKWASTRRELEYKALAAWNSRAMMEDQETQIECTEQKKVCGQCSNFIGGGDWGLCCEITYDLCYENTKACDDFKPKEAQE